MDKQYENTAEAYTEEFTKWTVEENIALRKRVEELASALRNFSYYLIHESDSDGDLRPVLVKHIRAARAALKGGEQCMTQS